MNNIDQNLGKENTPNQEEERLTVEKVIISIKNAFEKASADIKSVEEGCNLSILPSSDRQKLFKGYSERVIADLDYMKYLRDFADPNIVKYIDYRLVECKSNDLTALPKVFDGKITEEGIRNELA
jgi:hypothetical protein